MKRVGKETVEALRVHAQGHPEDSYAQMAATFGISEISVKRYCADLGRGKDWRKGRKQESTNGNRFWSSVGRSPDGCWPWKGCRNGSGYGTVHFDGMSQGAHRVSYTLTNGAIPAGTEIDHKCRNRACCNPSHLEAITHEENMARVRQVQAEKAAGVQHISSSTIDPGLDIDTRPTKISEQVGTSVSPLIDVYSLNPESRTPRPGSVSIAPGVPDLAMKKPTPEEDLAQEFHDRAWKNWGDCPNSRQRVLLPDGTCDIFPDIFSPDSFSYYVMNVDGVEFRMIARSEPDARSIVEKFWGVHPRISVEEDGKPDEYEIDTWLRDWSRRLESYFEDWKRTGPGRDWVAIQEQRRSDLAESRHAGRLIAMSSGINMTGGLSMKAKGNASTQMIQRTSSGESQISETSVACGSEAIYGGNFMGDTTQNSSGVQGGRSTLDSWLATRRWTTTGSGNIRRVVNTRGHAFVVAEMPEEVRALYMSDEDGKWVTIAVKKTLAEAKAALLPCAIEAQIQWL